MLVVFEDYDGEDMAVESTRVVALTQAMATGYTWLHLNDVKEYMRVRGTVVEVAAALNGGSK